MKSRLILAVVFLFAGMLLAVTPVLAGGWAVITLDELPGEVIAGEPLEIGFTVRQHGVTPMDGLTPVISARYSGYTLSEEAKAQGETGHYVATLTFPQEGEWRWSIQAFTVDQSMPTLRVITAPAVAQSQAPERIPANISIMLGSLGFVGLAAGLFVALRWKVRWAYLLIAAGLLLGGASVAYAANPSQSVPEAAPFSAVSRLSQVDVGRQLFIAKGCMICHSHSETNGIREIAVDMGPNLTNFTASPEYLRVWLKDPQAAKPNAQMPNLELKEAEIEALIAFINAD